jgi:hypothetical protein
MKLYFGLFIIAIGIGTSQIEVFANDAYLYSKKKYRGNYLYPVNEEDQAKASWILKGLKWSVVNRNVKVQYYLPVELVGDPVEINMTGKIPKRKSFFKIKGKYGTGVCLPRKDREFSCLFKFKKLAINKKIIADYLEKKVSNKEIKTFKYTLATLFRADPIGVLNITHD